jgi:hypothetical protein
VHAGIHHPQPPAADPALEGRSPSGPVVSAPSLPSPLPPLAERLFAEKCDPLHVDREVRRLGYLEERDDLTGELYGFVVCQRRNLNSGEWDVIIQSNRAVGAGLTPEQATEKAAVAAGRGAHHYNIGIPFTPLGRLDPRRVEYRVHQTDGTPVVIEVRVTMRDARRLAKTTRTLQVPWPTA